MTVRNRSLRTGPGAPVCSTALLMLLLSGLLSPAFADGGAGGGGSPGGDGGTGGTLDNPQGGEGGSGPFSGGGGGGGGPGGGAGSGGPGGGAGGGDGGEHGFVGDSLPTSDVTGAAGGNGGDGRYFGSGDGNGGGGGGAGGYGAILDIGGTAAVAIDQTIFGGRGGDGGRARGFAGGGGGGDGGLGFSFSGEALTNAGAISGGAGGDSMDADGGPAGRGGDGGLGLSFSGVALTNAGTISGGAGGDGGSSSDSSLSGYAGRGGDGGLGLSFSGGALTNTGMVSGGAGGDGGLGLDRLAGNGGVGVSISAATLTNTNSIVGGAGGAVDGDDSARGAGGAGIVGADLAIINSGTISGGLAGDGAMRADAITFTGGNNRLELQAGSAITGNVDASASTSAALALGGAGDFTFDTTAFGTTFLGFTEFEKVGTSRWSLIGATAATMHWNLDEGVLSIVDAANLGDSDGTLTFDGGTLEVDASTSLSQAIQLEAGGGTIETGSTAWVELGGDITGLGALTKTGEGALFLAGKNDYSGNTHVREGILLALTDTGLSKNSAHILDAGTILVVEADVNASIGSLAGAGSVGAGALLTGPASLTTGFDGTDTTFSGTIVDGVGSLSLTKTGTGIFTLSGINSYTGPTIVDDGVLEIASGGSIVSAASVDGGLLRVDGVAGGVTVNAGAALGGSGTVGTTTIASGGTLSPGNSIGTLTVDGDLVFDAGARFAVEVNPQGSDSDLVSVTGDATLNGGAVAHIGASGEYALRSTYTILSADGTLSGAFDEVSSDFAFLTPDLMYDYGAGTVDLELTRNDRDFAAWGHTRNQIATSTGIESIGFEAGHAVYDAIVRLADDSELIRASFDALSGEVHGSVRTVLVEDSRFIRNAANDRIRAAFGDAGAPATPIFAYRPGAAVTAVAADHAGPAFWSHGFGSWGSTDSDGNAASLDRSTGGVLIGTDGLVGNWRIGFLAGYSHSRFDVDDRASSGSSDNYHLGLYGGTQWGHAGFRTGLAYSWHDIDTYRAVSIPGLTDSLTAGYDAGTFQAFGELGYGIDLGDTRFEPFANLAHVSLHTDGFGEGGGAAALSAAGNTTDVTFTTLGLRAEHNLAMGSVDATLHGMVGWRHAFGDTAPESSHAFSGSDAFTIAGAPIAKDSAVIEAGLDLNMTRDASFGLSYVGQIAGSARDHGFKANFNMRF